LLLFLFPPLSPPSLAAKVLVVISRPRPRLKVLPSSLLPLAHNASFKKGVFVSALIPAFFITTKFREEEEEAQEAQDKNARIYLFSLSNESQEKSPKLRVSFFLVSSRLGFSL
jgi:hypothetical protein